MKTRKIKDILEDIRRNLNKHTGEAFDCGGKAVNAWIDDIEECLGNGRFSVEISSRYSKTGKPILINLTEKE